MGHGISWPRGIHMWAYMTHVIFTTCMIYITQDLAMESIYTINENDYWDNKPPYSHAGKAQLQTPLYLQLPCTL